MAPKTAEKKPVAKKPAAAKKDKKKVSKKGVESWKVHTLPSPLPASALRFQLSLLIAP